MNLQLQWLHLSCLFDFDAKLPESRSVHRCCIAGKSPPPHTPANTALCDDEGRAATSGNPCPDITASQPALWLAGSLAQQTCPTFSCWHELEWHEPFGRCRSGQGWLEDVYAKKCLISVTSCVSSFLLLCWCTNSNVNITKFNFNTFDTSCDLSFVLDLHKLKTDTLATVKIRVQKQQI